MSALWTCEVCGGLIGLGEGAVRLRAKDEAGEVQGYPREPTSDPANAVEWRTLKPRLAMLVAHYACDPLREQSSYEIGTDRAYSLEQWCSWALHLYEKTWMGRLDHRAFLALWFTNRGLDYSDVA